MIDQRFVVVNKKNTRGNSMRGLVLSCCCLLFLCGCGGRSSGGNGHYEGRSYASYDSSYDEEDEREPFDEDAAREAAEDDLAIEGYDYRYGCTDDCSGHEAGWQWRAENGYSTDGDSDSFSEGGSAFEEALDERVEEMRDAYEAGEDPEY
jgi:hypothetical protein